MWDSQHLYRHPPPVMGIALLLLLLCSSVEYSNSMFLKKERKLFTVSSFKVKETQIKINICLLA
jgi:hypothetical protein